MEFSGSVIKLKGVKQSICRCIPGTRTIYIYIYSASVRLRSNRL